MRCAPFVEFFHVERKNSISAIPVDKRSYIGGSLVPNKVLCVCIPSIQFDKPFGIGIRRTPTELQPFLYRFLTHSFSFIILMLICDAAAGGKT